MTTDSPVMTIEQAAEYLQIGRSSAYLAARTGELPVIKIGRRLLVSRVALLKKLAEAGSKEPAHD